MYVFFGSSAPRWALLKAFSSDQETKISLKSLCTTRWESRHSSVTAIITRFPDLVKTLTHLTLTGDKPAVRNEAANILNKITKLDFILPLLLWEKILRAVRAVSKLLQSKTVDLSNAVQLLETAVQSVATLRDDFERFGNEAKAFAAKWHVDATFEEKRRRKATVFADELAVDERLHTTEGRFRVGVYLPKVDTCLNRLKRRFESLELVVNTFRFLFPKTLADSSDEQLSRMVAIFVSKYADDVSDDLLSQVLAFRSCAAECIKSAQANNNNVKDLLNFIIQLDLTSSFPDFVTALSLFLTLPVSVASDERSFSKLKLIKTYLRSCMTQERLSDLALLSIEKERFKEIYRNAIVRDFANAKARKRSF